MNLQELKRKAPADLLAYAEELQVENASNLRKQDMMFAILKRLADNDVAIFGDASVPYGRLVEILDICRTTGLRQVVLMVRPSN